MASPHFPNSLNLTSKLSEQGIYECPVCHLGKISPMLMMETLSCDFCSHMFVIDDQQQILALVGSTPPLSWQWHRQKWRIPRREGIELGVGLKVGAVVLVMLPTAVMTISAYTFPPLPDSPLAWVPTVWIGLTFIAHLACVLSIMVDYYQFPMSAYGKACLRGIINGVNLKGYLHL